MEQSVTVASSCTASAYVASWTGADHNASECARWEGISSAAEVTRMADIRSMLNSRLTKVNASGSTTRCRGESSDVQLRCCFERTWRTRQSGIEGISIAQL